MREITCREAVREALREELQRDEDIFLIGEDIGFYGGTNKVTQGLWQEFGSERIMDTPISEAAIIGAALGAAAVGMRPVAEIMFIDFIGVCMDQIANQVAKLRYMTGGKVTIPLTIRAPGGAGRSAAAQHSQSLEAWLIHTPGLLVAMPSTPYDTKGLLKAAIREDNPVVFIENKMLYNTKGPVPEGEYVIPLGKADIKREGGDVTLVATSRMVYFALEAAAKLADEGIECEVVDPRTLVPLDKETILESVAKTGRLVVVHEAPERGGFGAELAAVVGNEGFDYLDAPIERVCSKNAPIPFSPRLERFITPQVEDIMAAVRTTVLG
ncbi:MAG: alpha-ketoacid dehydrogenase subunit beta [Limnochordia bacterium]|jgi:pyruvate/2-oxoglutarate/acetoin dehydrogenase E1 component